MTVGPQLAALASPGGSVAAWERPGAATDIPRFAGLAKSAYEASVRGVFTYRVDEAGKLRALRGYWTMADVVLEPPP